VTATIRVGGASGYWGDSAMATPQLLAGGVDYLVYDYLAEITMSILARARAKDPSLGYATDFVSAAMQPHLGAIAANGVKVIANAGGMNPRACAERLRGLIREQGLGLRVAVVLGDDLLERREELAAAGLTEMFNGSAFPPVARIASINAYLGAFPIARALAAGADIVLTGRVVDSALALGACIHAFGWARGDLDRLAQGSLAGHLLECGTQATGGNFTDWESVVDTLADAGYPIAEIAADGSFVCTKPAGTGGTVSRGTVAEQLLYEIGDPQAYVLPDVVCDFSAVRLEELGTDRVQVSGARGAPPPADYKLSVTWADGFRGGEVWTMYGRDAETKARRLADGVLRRARRVLAARGLADYRETSLEVIGAEAHYGVARRIEQPREVSLKLAARHDSAAGIEVLFKETVGMALAAPPGLTGFAGGRPKPSPVVRLFSTCLPKNRVAVSVEVEGELLECDETPTPGRAVQVSRPLPPPLPLACGACIEVPLERLAWARSGDKGDKANIGVIARRAEYLPWIWAALDEAAVAARFAHFLTGGVERFLLPGLPAINFVLDAVLGGGGVASLRSDPQGKGYAQLLLEHPVAVPAALLEDQR
jgi:hypothetical protein